MVCMPSASCAASPGALPCTLFQYWEDTTGMFKMVKYLFRRSKLALAPPRRHTATAAAGLYARSAPREKNSRSSKAHKAPLGPAKYTGEPIIMPSHSAAAWHSVLYTSSANTHLPVSRHLPQAIQPASGLTPMCTICVSTPSSCNVLAASDKAKKVLPSLCGLPLINKTFIFPPKYRAASAAAAHIYSVHPKGHSRSSPATVTDLAERNYFSCFKVRMACRKRCTCGEGVGAYIRPKGMV